MRCSRLEMAKPQRQGRKTTGVVGRTPRSAADAPVGLLTLCRMLIPLARQRDEGVPPRPRGPAPPSLAALEGPFFMKFRGPKAHPNRPGGLSYRFTYGGIR